MRHDLERCLGAVNGDAGVYTASASFPRDFFGFRGHFPERPIVPGVCLMQVLQRLVELGLGRSITLNEVSVAKFFNVVEPDQSLELSCSVDANTANGQVMRGQDPVAKIKFRFTDA